MFNAVVVRGNATGEVMFYGQGAGELPTASACVADVMEALQSSPRREEIGWEADPAGFEDPQALRSRYYFRIGGSLDAARAAALLPARADTVSLYRRIRGGHVAAADLQPVFAAEGPQNTGKTLASLTALQELGLIEEQEGRWLPVPVTAKQDLASAPVLQKLAELAKQA